MQQLQETVSESLNSVNELAAMLSNNGSARFNAELYTFNNKWVHSNLIKTEDLGLCCVDLQIKIPKGDTIVTKAEIEMDPLCRATSESFGAKGRVGVPWKLTLTEKKVGDDGETYTVDTQVLVKSTLNPTLHPPKNFGNTPPSNPTAVFAKLNGDDTPCITCWLPPDFTQWTYVGFDEFTNETLIAGIINQTWTNHALKYDKGDTLPFVQHYQASLCGQTTTLNGDSLTMFQNPLYVASTKLFKDDVYVNLDKTHYGVNMMELCDLGNLRDYGQATEESMTLSMHYIWSQDRSQSKDYLTTIDQIKSMEDFTGHTLTLPDKIVKRVILQKTPLLTIFFQVLTAIDVLGQLAFFQQGDLKVANIFLKSVKSTLKHKNITCKSDFTAKVADFGKSSINCDSATGEMIRVFKYDPLSVTYLSKFPFNANIKTLDNDIEVYVVDNTTDFQTYSRTRYMGIPFYSSFDMYMFVVSMMMQPCFYYSMMAHPDVYKAIWEDGLWIHDPESGNQALKRIKKIIDSGNVKKQVSTGGVLGVLSKLNLACDVSTPIFESLAATFPDI